MKLHLGCGKKFLPGFVHIDLAEFPHIDHKRKIYPLDFIESNSISEIYCCHALEYYDFFQCLEVLEDWNRCLTSGGVLRLSVPDFDKLLKVYELSNRNIDSIIGPIFGRWKCEQDFIYHRTVFTRNKLEKLLLNSGYSQIKDWDPLEHFGKSSESYDDYSKAYHPKMDFENGFPISINLVAIK